MTEEQETYGNELIQVDTLDISKLWTTPGMDEVLHKINDRARELEPDTSTEAGRKEIASMAYKISRSKTLIDNLGKDTVVDWKKKAKAVDKYRKQARDFLDNLKAEVRQPLTEWESEEERQRQIKIEAEEKRVAGIRVQIEAMSMATIINTGWETAADVKKTLSEIEAVEIHEAVYQEFTDEAIRTKADTLANLNTIYEDRKRIEDQKAAQEAEAERLEKERLAQEEEKKRIYEENRKIAEEKAKIEKAKLEAENEKIKGRVNQMDGVIFNGEEAVDGTGMKTISREDLVSLPDPEFDRIAKSHNKIVADKKAEKEAELKAQAEKEAREKLEKEEQEKREQEEAEQKEAERKEALKPDREKLMDFSEKVFALAGEALKLESQEAKDIYHEALDDIMDVSEKIKRLVSERL